MIKQLLTLSIITAGVVGVVFLVFGTDILTEDKWVHVLSLSLILGYLSLGLFRKDLNFGQSFQYIFIWIGIGLVLVLGYAYRHDLTSLKQRLAAELNPANGRTLSEQKQITFAKAEDGHFYIEAEVNGVAIRFMVDTGASRVVLKSSDARKLGLDVDQLDYLQKTNTANGSVWSAPLTINQIAIHGYNVFDIPASVSNSDLDTSLLGMSFLDKLQGYKVDAGGLTLQY